MCGCDVVVHELVAFVERTTRSIHGDGIVLPENSRAGTAKAFHGGARVNISVPTDYSHVSKVARLLLLTVVWSLIFLATSLRYTRTKIKQQPHHSS